MKKPRYNERAAIAEGWIIAQAETGLRIKRLENTPAFDADEQVWEHVVAQAWAGSPTHRRALELIEAEAPDAFVEMGVPALIEASRAQREAEKARYEAVLPATRERLAADPAFVEEVRHLLDDILREHRARQASVGARPTGYEYAHFTLVSREAVIVALHDAETVEAAREQVRRRFCLSATPHEVFGTAAGRPDVSPEPS